VNPGQGLRGKPWRGKTQGRRGRDAGLKPLLSSGTLGRCEPGNRDSSDRSGASVAELNAESTVRRFASGGNAGKACSERDKPPKGESQECCRCETKPARDSRE
jgi:hypothetical protein